MRDRARVSECVHSLLKLTEPGGPGQGLEIARGESRMAASGCGIS